MDNQDKADRMDRINFMDWRLYEQQIPLFALLYSKFVAFCDNYGCPFGSILFFVIDFPLVAAPLPCDFVPLCDPLPLFQARLA